MTHRLSCLSKLYWKSTYQVGHPGGRTVSGYTMIHSYKGHSLVSPPLPKRGSRDSASDGSRSDSSVYTTDFDFLKNIHIVASCFF